VNCGDYWCLRRHCWYFSRCHCVGVNVKLLDWVALRGVIMSSCACIPPPDACTCGCYRRRC
jgi:hypothetical protein